MPGSDSEDEEGTTPRIVSARNSLSMSGMIAPLALTEDQEEAYASRSNDLDKYVSSSRSDGWTKSGGLIDENRYAMQSLMVTNPTRYAAFRLRELEPVKAEVNMMYNSTLRKYMDIGADIDYAEKKAAEAANKIKSIAMDAFEAKYPTSNDSKLLEVQHKNQKYSSM